MFSIIIPTFNNLEYLKLCLSSIKKNSSFSHEIIIHINEGTDGTKAFLDKFGAPIEQLDQLVKAKTVTISKLMEIAPSGTVDPTPSLYNTTMYAMAGLLIVAFFSNFFMKPVHSKHFVENTHPGTLK